MLRRSALDVIQEFKLLTGTYPAEYGRSNGAQVVVITKSGTNQFHGGVFEFVRNQVFDARNTFTLMKDSACASSWLCWQRFRRRTWWPGTSAACLP